MEQNGGTGNSVVEQCDGTMWNHVEQCGSVAQCGGTVWNGMEEQWDSMVKQ